jgi:hypothetical protein
VVIWQIFVQFVLRGTFAVGLTLAVISPQLAAVRFHRRCLGWLAGVNALAAFLLVWQRSGFGNWPGVLGLILAAAFAGGLTAARCRDSRSGAGTTGAWVVAMLAAVAGLLALPWRPPMSGFGVALAVTDLLSGGLLLGGIAAVVLFGNWYLQTPKMALVPWPLLIRLIAGAVVVRTGLCAVSLILQLAGHGLATRYWVFLGLRWASAVLAWAMLFWLARETRREAPAATDVGRLFSGVLLTLVAEATAQFVPVDALYPV